MRISIPLDLEQPPLHVLRVVGGKARLDAARLEPDAVGEVGEEQVGLCPLQLPVLGGGAPQAVVQFHRHEGRSPGLILSSQVLLKCYVIVTNLRCFLSKPEVDIPGLLTSRANLCVQDNIGISNVELSILFSFLIKYRLKILELKKCLKLDILK